MTRQILVKDWMSSDPITITWNASVIDAYQMMVKHEIRRLPVVDEETLVGIVTLGDVRVADPSEFAGPDTKVIRAVYGDLGLDRVMSRPVVTVEPNTTIQKAARLMLNNKIAGLPVVEEGRLVGILTESDLFQVLVDTLEPSEANVG